MTKSHGGSISVTFHPGELLQTFQCFFSDVGIWLRKCEVEQTPKGILVSIIKAVVKLSRACFIILCFLANYLGSYFKRVLCSTSAKSSS